MTDFKSEAGDGMERAVFRAHRGMEWIFVFAVTGFLVAEIAPRLIGGAQVYGR